MPLKRDKDGRRVLMGQVATGTYNGSENRIHLFDGKFTTGYRVVEFNIAPREPAGGWELTAMLSTEPKSELGQWDWHDVQEVAWCAVNIPTASRFGYFSNIRKDNMAIEDLWIRAYTTGSATSVNYEIVLEKYEFPAWDGAGILVENLSQAGPQ